MNQIPGKIFICAGEASGDLHASAVIDAMLRDNPDLSFFGVAGPAMREAGCHAIHQMNELNVMGIGDVIRALPRIQRVEASLCRWAEENRPALAILVDFPGFNMRLGRKLKAAGIPVLYYIAPKLWAWGAWRSGKLKRSQDCLASILPFEVEWFKKHGIEARYVGNPSAASCKAGWSREELRQKLGLGADDFLLALLPGSRPGELARHAGVLADLNTIVRAQFPRIKSVVTRAPGVTDEQLKPLLDSGVMLIDRLDNGYAMRADAAVAVSGTATLELALWDVPTVLVYRGSSGMMWLARKLVRVRCAGLANILLGDQAVIPELIQEKATAENIMKELVAIISGSAADQQRQKFSELRALLGEINPADEVAELALQMLEKKPLSRP
ncbi:MAG: lipid-A-disaccharide synthase [Mariprofundaceae bacterium]|nr:lipid-A-disaccharide synthase [Mariprofundaceae bacterium]